MTSKKRIACFFTGGFTELNSMKEFMQKINKDVEFIQLCPIASRKSKDAIKRRLSIESSYSGLSGQSLLDYVLNSVEKSYFSTEGYDAILIEDDKDSRFLSEQKDGSSAINNEDWELFKNNVKQQLEKKKINIPVIIFLAAPEVESWFISDWENSFGNAYTDELKGPGNKYFSTVFRRYINEKILTTQYLESVEAYGYFDGKYKKLSEEIQNALSTNDFMKEYKPYTEHKPIGYSKRSQGEIMLRDIVPENVLKCCNVFFKDGYYDLKKI